VTETGSSRRRPSRGDVAFAIAFGVYVAGGMLVLGQGVLAVAASASEPLHEALHVQGYGSGPLARIALRAADASHAVPSALQVALDHVFSLVHLAMAAILLWLRPRDRTARLLAVALVGAAGVFNLTAQGVLEQLPMTAVESFAQTAAHVVAGQEVVARVVDDAVLGDQRREAVDVAGRGRGPVPGRGRRWSGRRRPSRTGSGRA
jgi:hypothetical protein